MSEDLKDKAKGRSQKADWRALTDEQLLALEFEANDPESLEGVRLDAPEEDDPEIEFAYNMRSRGRKVRCVYCKYENHFEGIVVRYGSGSRNLVGRDCAQKHHQANFGTLLKDFDAGHTRQDYVRRKHKLLERRSAILAEMRDLQAQPAIKVFDRVRGTLRYQMGNAWMALANAAQAGGVLRIERRMRDHLAEQRRTDRLGLDTKAKRDAAKKNGELEPIMTTVSEQIGVLKGLPFFMNGASVGEHLRDIADDLRSIIWRLNEDGLSTPEIRDAIRRLGDLAVRLETEHTRLEALSEALDPENIAVAVKWLCREGQNRSWPSVRAASLLITVSDDRDREYAIELPKVYHPPSRLLVKALREALAIG